MESKWNAPQWLLPSVCLRWGEGFALGASKNSAPLGLLVLRGALRCAIWVIILEQRQYSGMYTHAFLCNIYPMYTLFSLFL